MYNFRVGQRVQTDRKRLVGLNEVFASKVLLHQELLVIRDIVVRAEHFCAVIDLSSIGYDKDHILRLSRFKPMNHNALCRRIGTRRI